MVIAIPKLKADEEKQSQILWSNIVLMLPTKIIKSSPIVLLYLVLGSGVG
jgi:hypothetical protein